jgi:spore germination protein YaaH
MKHLQKIALILIAFFAITVAVFVYLFIANKGPLPYVSPLASPGAVGQVTPSPRPDGGTTIVHGWIYPGPETCSVARELETTVKVDVLKPEYFTVMPTGELKLMTEDEYGCNGYSRDHVALMKKYSSSQYVTVSGRLEGMAPLVSDKQKRADAVKTLTTFVKESGFTGVEIDFEDFSSWKKEDYASYKVFLTELGTALHADGKQFMVAGPPTSNNLEASYYVWRYEDFNTLPVDHIVVMAYDYQADFGNGEPVAPNVWVQGIISLVQSKITDNSKIVIGIPSYGYDGTVGEYRAKLLTLDQAKKEPGFDKAIRDNASFEMIWRSGNQIGVYQDEQSLQMKKALVESLGVEQVSVWHLGGNAWF